MRKRLAGIKGKILISTMIVLLITMFSLSSIVIYIFNTKSYEDYYSNSTEQMKIVSQAINIFYEQIDKNIDMLATNPVIMQADSSITTYKNTTQETSMNPSKNEGIEQEIYKVFEQYATSHEGTSYVYLGTKDGGYIQWPEETTMAGFDPTKRPWFNQALEEKGSIIRTEPYEYKSQLLTSNARTITDKNGNIIGALGIDVQQAEISSMLSGMKTGETGYSMIIHNNGLIMADGSNANNNFKKIDEIEIEGLNKLLGEELTPFTVTVNNAKYIVNPYKVEGTEWILASFMSKYELESGARKIISSVAVSTVVILFVASLILSYVAGSITKPIIAVTKKVQEFAKLDFSAEANSDVEKYINGKDEIGDMVRALKVMRDNVANFIFNTSQAAEQVAASSEELTATSLQASTASEEIATTIEEIAKGAGDQAKDTEMTAINVEEMGKLLEQDFQYLEELNSATVQIEKQKEEGFSIIEDLINNTKKNNDASNNVYQIILSNNESAEKIDNASSMIQGIADQTNLLSLNAAIEAARAGDVGKGFAVVADEIRKLADQSNEFTKDIKKVISELKENSQNAVAIMQESKQIVNEQTQSVEATEEKFEGIAEAIDIIKSKIDTLNHSSKLMTSNKSKVIELTQNLAAISEENAAGTQEASAAMEEQAATIEEIARSGEGLATIAEELRSLIEKFKI
ncbi:methyl-accepting chemotaxis protein [Candidatus Galacturonibacter soehngenii]|uniref:Methyl-accepting chemotaxis protein n=1 Tax=Candidatus Galacturonatibacter soehngenii TaxID=2307010 RepID=A0A7V7QKY5_9FIRM|nr:methyl-accepting chemotaxis protein [Candidatus Galacturonibacter soehngenii]KAB1438411.1 methyl-accepting chemotaxis protein [Candidatus Galacturonibacter soehngenii]